MQTSLIVIDDFLDNIDALREAALRLDYPEPAVSENYPGRNSGQRLEIEGLEAAASQVAGRRLIPAPKSFHAYCRLTLEREQGAANVHIDACHWSGVLFLNPADQCQGGTDFYRHSPTGTERAPLTDGELTALGFSSHQEAWKSIIRKDTNDPAKWERVHRVPMRYNRLIMFHPWLYHNAGPAFGDRLETGRLVYLLFFNFADGKA